MTDQELRLYMTLAAKAQTGPMSKANRKQLEQLHARIVKRNQVWRMGVGA